MERHLVPEFHSGTHCHEALLRVVAGELSRVFDMVSQLDFLSQIAHLGASRHPEDQLSNTFAACFNQSVAFRHAVFRLFSTECKLRRTVHSVNYWCKPQHSNRDGGRYDLLLRCDDDSDAETLVLENKLEAPLTEKQLSRYRKAGAKNLIAVTRYLPAVSLEWLRSNSIQWIRWHDIHAAIAGVQATRSEDRFICRSFCEYLKALDMAADSISRKDIDAISAMFRTIANPCWNGAVNSIAFPRASALLDLMQAVAWEIENRMSEKHSIRCWGPGYWNFEEGGNRSHYLGFVIWRRDQPRFRLEVCFQFPEKRGGKATLQVYRFDRHTKEVDQKCDDERSITSLLSKNGRLTRQEVANAIVAFLAKWPRRFP